MRRFITIIFFTGIFFNGHCQTMRQGNYTLNAYYGYNVFTGFVRALAQASNSGDLPHDIKLSSIGPVGVTGEYMLNHMIGIGGEIGYSQTKMTYFVEGTDNAGLLSKYNYIWTVSATRIMGRINCHFGNNENFDVYPFIAGGLRLAATSVQTSDPNLPFKLKANFFPFGVKPGLGLRYFFTPNVGIFSEIALGTPLICAGISFKFKNESKSQD